MTRDKANIPNILAYYTKLRNSCTLTLLIFGTFEKLLHLVTSKYIDILWTASFLKWIGNFYLLVKNWNIHNAKTTALISFLHGKIDLFTVKRCNACATLYCCFQLNLDIFFLISRQINKLWWIFTALLYTFSFLANGVYFLYNCLT